MRRFLSRGLCLASVWLVAASGLAAFGQVSAPAASRHLSAAHGIMPQLRSWTARASAPVQVTAVDAGVVIVEQVATTTLDIQLHNPTSQRQLAEILLPVPDGAAVRGFSFQGAASEPTARLLTHAEARQTFDSIVARMKDPALLEFAGMNLIRSSVFPVEPGSDQKVRLTYEHLLKADGDRVDYVLPRSQSLEYDVPWTVHVKIKSSRGVATVYSPTHPLDTKQTSPQSVSTRIAQHATREPGSFRLSYLLERGAVTASLFAYPNPDQRGGYFLLLAGLDAARSAADGKPAIRRELTLVLDRSGSMNGEKLEQAREAALQVLSGLHEGETFNLIVYNDSITRFAARPLAKSAETLREAREFLSQVNAVGGTNIHDALLEALQAPPSPNCLPIVLFLTDGLPTVGQTSEAAIRKAAAESNRHERRIFTFGVGVDVNTPLLDKLAAGSRGFATFVLPGEDVEVKVGTVFRGLEGPVLASPRLHVLDADGRQRTDRVLDVLPSRLPDLFQGDQLVLLGRYLGNDTLRFELTGDQAGKPKKFQFEFSLGKSTAENTFVPRLWASRQIAVLTDQIRDLGLEGATAGGENDPRLRELTDEIVRLSTEFGILTEYTAFLAQEGTDLALRDQVLAEARRNFQNRAVNVRSGVGAVNQELNNSYQRSQQCLNLSNGYWTADLQRVAITNVQQVDDRAFYRRGNRWVESCYVEQSDVKPARVVAFGSEEHSRLLWELVRQRRQPVVSLGGDILLQLDNQPVLIQGPAGEQPEPQSE
ncbi:MAG: VWA domain-containing protein [Pirellulaceae bacterium]|nr:VWA domain-containing protein [Pirellulaceae bacterium]